MITTLLLPDHLLARKVAMSSKISFRITGFAILTISCRQRWMLSYPSLSDTQLAPLVVCVCIYNFGGLPARKSSVEHLGKCYCLAYGWAVIQFFNCCCFAQALGKLDCVLDISGL